MNSLVLFCFGFWKVKSSTHLSQIVALGGKVPNFALFFSFVSWEPNGELFIGNWTLKLTQSSNRAILNLWFFFNFFFWWNGTAEWKFRFSSCLLFPSALQQPDRVFSYVLFSFSAIYCLIFFSFYVLFYLIRYLPWGTYPKVALPILPEIQVAGGS